MGVEVRRQRSWIWKYFESATSTTYRCNLCTAIISVKSSKTNNMNRHVRLRHPSVYKVEIMKKNMNKQEKEWENEEENKDMSELEKQLSGEDNDKDIDQTKSGKRSWIWKYFESVTKTLYRCSLCIEMLAIRSMNTYNLNRHLRFKHSSVYKEEITKKDMNKLGKEGENEEENDKHIDETNDKMKKRSSWVWSYFKRLSTNVARCRFCRKNIHSCNSTGNLSRHLKIVHNKIGINTVVEVGRKRSWIWKYFETVTSTTYRCNLCHKMLTIRYLNTHNMNRHVRLNHSSVYKAEIMKNYIELDEEWKNEEENKDISELEQELSRENKEENDKHMDETCNKMKQRSSWVWSYFKRLSRNVAQCHLCSRNLHSCNSTGNLSRHLKIVHNKIDDTMKKQNGKDKEVYDHNWVWNVFETDEDDFYSCKICDYKIMKFEDINISVTCILKHLKDEHGVLSGDQIIVETELDIGCVD